MEEANSNTEAKTDRFVGRGAGNFIRNAPGFIRPVVRAVTYLRLWSTL